MLGLSTQPTKADAVTRKENPAEAGFQWITRSLS